MQSRLNYSALSPETYKAMFALEKTLAHFPQEPTLSHLLKLRVSQINGCAYCLDMHWKDLRALGEEEPRLYALDAWQESPLYSDRERAALELAEAMTLIADSRVPDSVFEKARAFFSDKEVSDLAWIIAAINAWNRIAITFRSKPGTYQSAYMKRNS